MKCSISAVTLAILLLSSMINRAGALEKTKQIPFIHPGILHSSADLDRIKKNVHDGIEPWASAWKAFQANRYLTKDYKPQPLETVGRGRGSEGQTNISWDATAAYYNAIAWYVTGEEDYAKKAVEILNAWSYKCKYINGKDAVLCAGIYGYKFVNAAEIIRYSYKKWPEKDVEQFKSMMNNVFYPVIKDFATYANGNWDTCCFSTMMSTAVFCDDRPMFDRAIRYYMDGAGDGSLRHYIINEEGQCQESGRDQGHTQAGIGHLIIAAEIAYHQGIDLYGAFDNRLLKGVEYTAKYNFGNDVPFQPYADRTGKYSAKKISRISRGRFACIYEMAYNHYQNRMGIDAPFTSKAALEHRPEHSNIDQPGNGTLLFALPPYTPSKTPPATAPATPGPIIAKGFASAINLQWPASFHALAYQVKRATTPAGPFISLAKNVKTTSYADKDVESGKLYYYVVSATNNKGTSPDTLPAGASAGLPKFWAQQDIGHVIVSGTTLFDGNTFALEASGTDIGGDSDQFQFAYLPLVGNGTITARFVPQVPSQFAKFGVMMRESLTPESANVSLLVTPDASESQEMPKWSIRLVARASSSAQLHNVDSKQALDAPYVSWGRFVEPYWLRLMRSGNSFTASISPDGKKWTTAATCTVPLKQKIFIGLAACSRLTKISTTVMFDHVSVPKQP